MITVELVNNSGASFGHDDRNVAPSSIAVREYTVSASITQN